MSDLISRQAAIEAICKEGTRIERNGTVAMCEIKQWCIDLLERLPSAQPEPCEDAVSRQAAIEAYGDWYVEEGTEDGFIGTVKQLLEGLPPVTLTYRQYGEKEGKMVVDVYVKWSKDEDFNRYHVTKGNIYTWMDFLRRAQRNNIIEEFYMYEIEE